ncbi:hypothetical protein DFH08DRAFT_681769 [Mycena albidolilacea]|uniref:CxC6 like cysteine cluster associated with KDZ domain-containing protein n=1 Tax=Mycena albidolilacea TaxID=1033008 RepID=A0AAD7F3T9_9AGAR|nr:hypothetical protein DFH08DRAFT_681769 [Mycena albidolilacea]
MYLDRMSAGVHDNVTVRHVVCSVCDCTEALLPQCNSYCPTNQDQMKVCCINGCDDMAQPGYRTCMQSAQRAFQSAAEQKNTAMFQLRSRLR